MIFLVRFLLFMLILFEFGFMILPFILSLILSEKWIMVFGGLTIPSGIIGIIVTIVLWKGFNYNIYKHPKNF